MKKTNTLITKLNKKRKITKTFIQFNTFNAKQTWIKAPKVMNLLNAINKLIHHMVDKKISSITKTLVLKLNKIDMYDNQYKELNIANKYMLYSSIHQLKNEGTKMNEYEQKYENQKIVQLYNLYLFMINVKRQLGYTKAKILVLPRKRTTYTILKSPHADKKAREQLMKEMFSIKIKIDHFVSLMKYVNKLVNTYNKKDVSSYKYNIIY